MTAGVRRPHGGAESTGELPHPILPAAVIADFLRAVKVPGTTFSTLQIFADALERDGVELVREVVRKSTGTEVASLLNDAHKLKSADIALIFTVLEKIILTVASEMEGQESFALELSEVLITKQLRTFYYMLKTTNKSNQMKSAFKLLIAMCALGGRTVKLLLTQFSFATCNFANLVTRRNTVDPQDVRACAVHLVVAILMFGDNQSIWSLLQTKNVISSLFAGLIVDRSQLIHLLLTTLLDRVVNNSTVSKTLKVQLFNQTSLRQLCRVLAWNGHKKSEKEFTDEDASATSSLEERSGIRDTVLRFLMAVCASTKYGIVFQDPTFGTGARNSNHVLTEILRSLTMTSAHHRELARVILIAAPDQIVHFLPSWKPGFVPRASDKWTDMMGWLDSIYTSMDVIGRVKKLPGKSRVPLALSLVLPTIMDQELQQEAFSDKQPVHVTTTFLKFLGGVLVRLYKISLVLSLEERKQFLVACSEKVVLPEVVAGSLLKLLSVPDGSPGRVTEVDVRAVTGYLVLDSNIFQRDLPVLISEAADLAPVLAEVVDSVRTELTAVLEQFKTSVSDGSGDFGMEVDVSDAVLLERQKKAESKWLRTSTLSLLLRVTESNPGLLSVSLMDTLMSAYTATLSEADQSIFDLIRRAEQWNPELAASVSFCYFGRAAQKHQLNRAKQGISLLPSQPTLREFVDSLDGGLIARTAVDFPIRLPLNGSLVGQLIIEDAYDPRYLLSNFAALIVAPASPINIQNFVESGCLGLIVRALSSLDPAMRSAAGFCLRGLIVKLGALRFKGREQLLYVLDLIKRANDPAKAWPSLWTTLLSRLFAVMFDSQNHAYQVIMEFLLVKPNISLDTVPEFYKLFESGNLTHGKERKYILEVLRDGVRHFRDYEIGRKSHVWELIMSFFGSPLSNAATDSLISEVFLSASRVPYVGRRLVKTNGYFTWLTYHLTASDNAELVGNLTASAAHCMRDLLNAKRRACFDGRSLIKPLLAAVERGVISVNGTEPVLLFLSDLLLCSPSSDDPSLLVLAPEDLTAVVDVGLKYLRFSRRNIEAAQWRQRCRLAVECVSEIRQLQSSRQSVRVHVVQRFLSSLTSVLLEIDVD